MMKRFVDIRILTVKRMCKFKSKILNNDGNICGGCSRCKILLWPAFGAHIQPNALTIYLSSNQLLKSQ